MLFRANYGIVYTVANLSKVVIQNTILLTKVWCETVGLYCWRRSFDCYDFTTDVGIFQFCVSVIGLKGCEL